MSGFRAPFTGPLIVKRIRDAIILNLRRAFSTDATFPYVENAGIVDFDCTKVVINDATPEDHFMLPSINVMTASGTEFRFLQEDMFETNCNVDGVVFDRRGAPMKFSVTVEATALDVITRDELLDRMYQKFKIVTDDLATNGVGVIQTTLRPDSRRFINDRWWYTSGVEMSLYAEWLEEDIIDPNSTLNGANVGITTDQGVNQELKIFPGL